MTYLTQAQTCVLLAIAVRPSEGILEASLEQYALECISEPIDVGETIDQFECDGWIETSWEVLTGERKSLKTRRCKISEVGREVAGNPKFTLSPTQDEP